jgi:hypothetical protein
MPMPKMQIYAEILRQLGEIPNDYDKDMMSEEEMRLQMMAEEEAMAEGAEMEEESYEDAKQV